MKEITILLSACGSPSMPGMIACFRNNGERRIRIVGMDMSEEPSNRYLVDAFYTVPAAKIKAMIWLLVMLEAKIPIEIKVAPKNTNPK